MVKMMLTVVIVFTCCWLPFNILQVNSSLPVNNQQLTRIIFYSFYWTTRSSPTGILCRMCGSRFTGWPCRTAATIRSFTATWTPVSGADSSSWCTVCPACVAGAACGASAIAWTQLPVRWLRSTIAMSAMPYSGNPKYALGARPFT